MNTKEQTVLPVRMSKDLKEAFLKIAKANDRNGSILVRDFIREYVKKNSQGQLL